MVLPITACSSASRAASRVPSRRRPSSSTIARTFGFLPEGGYGVPAGQVRTGAFETFGAGHGGADISCACH
jgi:hypothetical protein